MTIALFDLSGARFGGWASFTGHLALALSAVGEDTAIYHVRGRTEAKQRPWRSGLTYRNVSLDHALALAAEHRTVMTAVGKNLAEPAMALSRAGVPAVFHDPTERQVLALPGPKIVDRRANLAHIPDAPWLPHPYVRMQHRGDDAHDRLYNAVATSRIDYDKHTLLIIEANNLLLRDEGGTRHTCYIFGALNRAYEHYGKLPDGWRRWYCGAMPADDLWAGARVARHATHMVDMSVIAGDGGGTQYTHLEAMDAGAHVVLNRRWFTGSSTDDTMWPCCLTASDGDGLAHVLAHEWDWTSQERAAKRLLDDHSSTDLYRAWLHAIRVPQ